ncbi:Sulfur carrier protein adenylyltransferase ThiF [Sandaracinus amylolyticus]|uniref:Sulfur carrier protein adenylyltransferase ThiF n=1 Tax=Sandaracinus amylolyticus TaxID=927083 RepID=A0A0F6SFE7_9BACT|nr:Sulfur carrier protein adenylyltransferase ThiF [Sandaracinus amylolyticus]
MLVIGAGGLGCAAGIALARSGLELDVTLVDPDRVERSNLHRQVLFDDRDVGHSKAERAAEKLHALSGGAITARGVIDRVDVTNAEQLARAHDVVVEGTDRHESKFLAADAAALARTPVVHAGVVRWAGWAMASTPFESACLRCVFEDVPSGEVETCSEAGVIGPAVGVMGALEAALAVQILEGRREVAGVLHRFDARTASARTSRVKSRASCPLCGERATIRALDRERYAAPACAT